MLWCRQRGFSSYMIMPQFSLSHQMKSTRYSSLFPSCSKLSLDSPALSAHAPYAVHVCCISHCSACNAEQSLLPKVSRCLTSRVGYNWRDCHAQCRPCCVSCGHMHFLESRRSYSRTGGKTWGGKAITLPQILGEGVSCHCKICSSWQAISQRCLKL